MRKKVLSFRGFLSFTPKNFLESQLQIRFRDNLFNNKTFSLHKNSFLAP